MSSGKAHARASKLLALPAGLAVGAFCQWVGDYWVGSLLAGSGVFVGCGMVGQIIGPDLDQIGITRNEWTAVKWLGPAGGLFIAFFFPYAWLFSHRSPWTHFPVISTIIRIVYTCAPLLLVRDWVASKMTIEIGIVLVGAAVGLTASDLMHYLMDFMPKRKRRRRRRRR